MALQRPAQYLLRIDDLSPTMDHRRWSGIRELIRSFGIRPILAVIPDNQDYVLSRSAPNPEFWEEMRDLENKGATIAMHGYRHECILHCFGVLPIHRYSEFAGLPLEEQCIQIRAGLALLRGYGLSPRLFVAPNHSFDNNTMRALSQEGLPYLSDGFARIPFRRRGVTWIPQQLWSPASRKKGLWTICMHPDSTGSHRLRELAGFLEKHAGQFTSFDEVVRTFRGGRLSPAERIHEQLALWRVVWRAKRKRQRGD